MTLDALFFSAFIAVWCVFLTSTYTKVRLGRAHEREVRRLKSDLDAANFRYDMLKLAVRTHQSKPTPPRQDMNWRTVLGFASNARPSRSEVNRAYHTLAKSRHPDTGGSVKAMAELNIARTNALREVAA